jgi:hypothetical protein
MAEEKSQENAMKNLVTGDLLAWFITPGATELSEITELG